MAVPPAPDEDAGVTSSDHHEHPQSPAFRLAMLGVLVVALLASAGVLIWLLADRRGEADEQQAQRQAVMAQTEQFKLLQERTVENARALSDAFQEHGLRVVYGGTNTHIVVLDLGAVKSSTERRIRRLAAAVITGLMFSRMPLNICRGRVRSAGPVRNSATTRIRLTT